MTIKKTAKWAAPALFKPDLDKQVEKALKNKEVKEAYKNFDGDSAKFKSMLRDYIDDENKKNYRLVKFSNFVDSFNHATVPIDSALDYFNIMGGIGYAAKGLKDLATTPGYLAYDLYYLGKTHDLIGTLENIGYEGISWLSLGGLPHLLNHYTKQAEKYSLKKGSENFLKGIKKGNLEDKIINFEEEKEKLETDKVKRKAA